MLTPRSLRRLTAACLLALSFACAHAARQLQPAVHLPLESLGIPPLSQAISSSGAVMLTAHFLDSNHVLVTYGLRGLVERIPDDPPEHNDRAVGALLVELPTGKILARARWHLHDYNRFLWPLGNGRFLLRIESRLVTIAPMRNLTASDPFVQMPFIRAQGLIEVILVAPEGDLVTVETTVPRKQHTAATVDEGGDEAPRGPVTISFYRVEGEGTADDPLFAVSAGVLRSPSPGVVPINNRGILTTASTHRDAWLTQFNGFNGETRKLSEIPSSCPPVLQPLGLSHYLVFSCRGSNDRIVVSEYNFLPHEMWEEPMAGTQPFGLFAFAPAAGRFAMSRLVTITTGTSNNVVSINNGSDTSTSQDVRVYQAESGDLLLKLTPTPTAPSGQNFDLASDGMSFLVLNAGYLDVYRLPALSRQDMEDLATLKPTEPPVVAEFNIRQAMHHAAEKAVDPVPAVVGEPSAGLTVASAAPAPPPQPTIINGDRQSVRRTPPTLLNPGEKAEFGEKKKKDPAKE